MVTTRHLLRALLFGALLVLSTRAADSKKSYDLPSTAADQALKRFSEISGRETLFAAEAVRGVRTTAIKGEFTPKEALDKMLDGTGLVAVQDEKTGALAVKRDSDPNAQRVAQKDSDRPTSQSKVEDGKLVLDPYQVAGIRDSGLVNEGVIPRREKEAINYIVFDRAEIERSGATDINEILRSLPQVAAFQADTQSLTAQRGFATFGAGVTAATRVDMRGFGNAGTTFLVNGRRVPLVRETQGGGPDISRIPLAAIERIEVLPGSAGGIYGTNTLGGVINIILKKNYTGRELTLSYGQAAVGGANETGLTYTEGRSLWNGKANLTWTFDVRKREPMYYENRPLYRRFLDHNLNPTNGGSITDWINSGGMLNFIPRPGVIVANSFQYGPVVPLNIPGGPANVMFASVPRNQDGTNLTPASFLATANQMTISEPYRRFALFNPSEDISLNLTFNHELQKDRLFWYAELGLGHSQYKFTTPANPMEIDMDASDPRNPFRTGVVPGYAGQAATLYYLPSDIPGTEQISKNSTARLVLGMNGKLNLFGRDWKWALDTSSDYNRRYAFGYTPPQTMFYSQVFYPTPAGNAFYNIFADHDALPNTAAAKALARSSSRENSDYVWQTEVTARANGELFDLPAGPVHASVVAGGRDQNYKNTFESRFDQPLMQSLGVDAPDGSFPSNTDRSTKLVGSELTLPVLGKNATLLGVHRLDFVGGYSYNWITDAKPFGSENLGVLFAPVPDVSFRVSYGAGTYPPQDFQTAPTVLNNIVGATTKDPRRGNTAIGNYTQIGGGNPDLKPEQTTTWNFGLVFQPRQIKGFTATFDYGFIGKVNGIQSLSVNNTLANEQYFPDRVVRAAPTATDTALGWAGQILSINGRRLNTGNIWSQYLDTSVRYDLATESAGNFYFIFRSTNTREFKTRLRTGVPIIDTLDKIGSPLRFKGAGSITWRKGPWTVTPGADYIESYRDDLNVGVGNSLTVNLQVSYEVKPGAVANAGWRRWLAGTQWTVGCNNVADAEPPFVQNPGGQSNAAYYSTYDDPRGRYLYLRIRKNF
jgi:outer membrane receptor protein involved in Fe transport